MKCKISSPVNFQALLVYSVYSSCKYLVLGKPHAIKRQMFFFSFQLLNSDILILLIFGCSEIVRIDTPTFPRMIVSVVMSFTLYPRIKSFLR